MQVVYGQQPKKSTDINLVGSPNKITQEEPKNGCHIVARLCEKQVMDELETRPREEATEELMIFWAGKLG